MPRPVMVESVPAPGGMRWCSSGGSAMGGAPGYHLAHLVGDRSGAALCGRYAGHRTGNPDVGTLSICRTCARLGGLDLELAAPPTKEER